MEKKTKRSRRGRGEGSVFQRADGMWTATIDLGPSHTGKRQRKVVYAPTKAKVLEKANKLRSDHMRGELVDSIGMTVAEYLSKWVKDSARLKVRETTLESYLSVINRHINPRVGGLKLQKLTPMMIDGMYSSMSTDGCSPRLRQIAHTILRKALTVAVQWRILAINPCLAVERPKTARKEMRTLDPQQCKILLAGLKSMDDGVLFGLALLSGLRLGELLGLEWSDIDLKSGVMNVQRSLAHLRGKYVINEPKTSTGRRSVKLPALAVELLVRHRAGLLAAGLAGVPRVFIDETGEPLKRWNVSRRMKEILRSLKLPAIRFHDLRHSHATLLLAENVHPKIVMERLGHSSIGITLDTYSHVLPDMQNEAVEKLDRLSAGEAVG